MQASQGLRQALIISGQAPEASRPRVIGVGLDGVYRPRHAGRPIIARGVWADAQTFVIDYNEGPGLATYTLRLHFDGDEVIFEAAGLYRVKANKK